MVGKVGFAVVAAVDLVAVEVSVVSETHGSCGSCAQSHDASTRDVVWAGGVRAVCSSLLARQSRNDALGSQS